MAKLLPLLVATALFFGAEIAPAIAQEESEVGVSPKEPWGEFTISEEEEKGTPLWTQILLWIPNRIMDAWDIFRLDLGAGPAVGAVARLSEHGQMGYRQVAPFSVRVGAFGRNAPVKVETANEFGIGPGFVSSKDRKVCQGEIGLGLDLVVGGYAGICADEVLDFAAGIFFLDIKGDDIR